MIAFYLLVAVMPLVRHSLWSETHFAGLTLHKYLGVICVVIALCHLNKPGVRPSFLHSLQSKLFLLFALATLASFEILGPETSSIETSHLANWVSFVLLFFTTIALVDSLARLRLVLLSLIGGVAFASAHLIRESIAYGFAAGSRPGWVTGDPNYFSLSALLALPVALLLGLNSPSRWERLFCWTCVGLTLVAFAQAGSRGGFLGLVVSYCAFVWGSRRRRLLLVLALPILALFVLVTPTSPLARLFAPSQPDQESTAVRTALFWAGLDLVQHHPWTGIGVGNFKTLVGAHTAEHTHLRNAAHNTYLEVAAELGVLGLVAFLAILLTTLGTFRTVRRQVYSPPLPLLRTAAHGLEIGLLGAIVAIGFLSALHVRMLWFVVILSMVLRTLPATRHPVATRRLSNLHTATSRTGAGLAYHH